MATIAQIRVGLATNLSAIKGVQVSAYMLASPTPPAIHVLPASISYDAAFQRGHDVHTFTVQAFVAGLDQGSQLALDELLAPSGARSVKTALESDRTLGGVVASVHVTDVSGYNVVTLPDARQLLSADWVVEVLG